MNDSTPVGPSKHSYRGRSKAWNNHRYYLIARFRKEPTPTTALEYAQWTEEKVTDETTLFLRMLERYVITKEHGLNHWSEKFLAAKETDVGAPDHPSASTLPTEASAGSSS
jgi:hypothetical protein